MPPTNQNSYPKKPSKNPSQKKLKITSSYILSIILSSTNPPSKILPHHNLPHTPKPT